jgi:hypothetical protein
VIDGLKILREIQYAIYKEGDFRKSEKLLSSALKSNGPFYALRYHMTSSIESRYGSAAIVEAFPKSSIDFFKMYIENGEAMSSMKQSRFLFLDKETEEKVNELKRLLKQ